MPDVIEIRPAIVTEQKVLEALQTRASLANPGDREWLLANLDAIEVPAAQIAAGQVFVAHESGKIVGFAVILPRPDGDAELDALFVEPNIWRQGIGRLLLDHCADAAKSAGSVALHVVGNPHAERFYVACGFVNVGTVSLRFGEGLLYRKAL
ncbi:MAG: GNAT family N-acetyltransferase [Steroidobacteraceae bacterium]|jgi:GNAT superfamily N-acetyltransferase